MTDPRIPQDERHWTEQLEGIRRRWRIGVATFVAFVTVAALLTWRTPPVYRATARLLVAGSSGPALLGDRMGALESYLFERQSFDTQLEVLRSEPVTARAARKLGWLEEDAAADARVRAAARVKGALAVEHLRDTRIVLVRGFGATPEGARDLANAVAEAYIEHTREQAADARRRSISWLTREIAQLRQSLRSSEERLLDYLATERLESVSDVDGAPGAAPSPETALRAEIAAGEIELAQLLRRYKERHPKVVEARARLATLERRLERSQTARGEEHRKLIQYRILKRDAELDHEMYEVLLKKLKEADVSADLAHTDIRILEPARTPHGAIAPRKARNLAVAGVLGLCAALGLALLFDSLDRRITSAEDVTRRVGLPTLGVLGRFEAGEGASRLVANVPGSLDAETFRALRTSVRFSDVDRPRRVVLVTSTGPEEGKSTVLANLGVSLAQAGRRVLLVDTDLRRPSLHRIFSLARGHGLADVLAGDARLEEAVRSTGVEGLSLLPCGTLPPCPAELIESARLQQLVASLREDYDYVLLDSPPAGGLVDAPLLSGLADGVLFVVEPRRFDARLLRTAVGQIERAGGRLYGVVLNKAQRVESAALYRYYAYGNGADGARARTASQAGAA